ncbi:MAG: hypothetical protein ACKESB_03500 [Candidatus Hodgkinia cicadicola]
MYSSSDRIIDLPKVINTLNYRSSEPKEEGWLRVCFGYQGFRPFETFAEAAPTDAKLCTDTFVWWREVLNPFVQRPQQP